MMQRATSRVQGIALELPGNIPVHCAQDMLFHSLINECLAYRPTWDMLSSLLPLELDQQLIQ
jgi:hypothetical protein